MSFSSVLNEVSLFAVHTARGSEFHKDGATTANARFPLGLNEERGTSKIIMLAKLRAEEGRCQWMRLYCKYSGASLLRDLKMNKQINPIFNWEPVHRREHWSYVLAILCPS